MMQTRSVATGFLVGFMIVGAVFGSLLLSLHHSLGRPTEIPIPTITLEIISAATPAPTFMPAAPSTPTPSSTPTLVSTPTPGSTPTPALTPSLTATACPTPLGWQRYVVGAFDTLSDIARRFNTTVDQLVQANCLPQPVVSVGQTIFVPPIGPAPTLVVCQPQLGWVPMQVRPGDTLSAIAQRYGLSVYYLMRANCLTSSFIYAGQTLYVPYVIAPPVTPVLPTPLPTDTPTVEVSPTPPVGPTDTPIPTFTVEPTPTDTLLATVTPSAETPTPAPPTDTPEPPLLESPTHSAPPSETPAPLAENMSLPPATPQPLDN